MRRKKSIATLLALGLLLLATSAWLAMAAPASAQCGSQASSCKNCHEVQGEMSVNSDGTSWHQAHAFGDFCYICHAGNNQATGKVEAHTGMVPPLSDVKASCQQCHVDDLMERAQVYADQLGVAIATGNTGGAGSGDGASGENSASQANSGSLLPIELVVDDPNVEDYVRRYNAIVLGERPINWGNVVLSILIGVTILAGGGFVFYNEGWVGVDYEKVDEYPSELVAFLPKIARLSPDARKKLLHILEDPNQAENVLTKSVD